MFHQRLVQACRGERHKQRLLHIRGGHCGCELPGNDVARKVIQHRGEVIPTPTLDLEVGEICLPEFMDALGGMLVLLCCAHHSEGRTLHQVKTLQDAVCAGFRDEIAFFIGEKPGNLPGRAVWMFQCQFHHLLLHFLRNAVPDLVRVGAVIHKSFFTFLQVLLVPAIEGTAWHLQFIQGLLHTQGRMLHQMNNLTLFCFIPANHSSHLASRPSKLFFKTRFFKVSSATTALSCSFSWRIASTSWLSASRFVSPTKRCLPASRNSLLHLSYMFWWIPSRRHSSAIFSSPRRPSKTIRTFSSAEYFLRVLRRISRTVASTAAVVSSLMVYSWASSILTRKSHLSFSP